MTSYHGEPVVITKRGKPLAKLVPIREDERKARGVGSMAGTILHLASDEELFSLAAGVPWDAEGLESR